MAQQFNGIIAQQTVAFRGTSAISVFTGTSSFPVFRAIRDARYTANLTGGNSGSFSVHVIGSIGGTTYIIAGLTAMGTTTTSYVLPPRGYDNGGLGIVLGTVGSTYTTLENIVPPSAVVFQSGVATAGISRAVTVSAVLSSGD